MKTEAELNAELTDDEKVLEKARGQYHRIKSDRNRLDYKFYLYERYYRGDHWTQWHKSSKTLREPPEKAGEKRIPIPLARTIINRASLELTRTDPAWDVSPDNFEDDSLKQASWANMSLDYQYYHGKVRKKLKQVVKSALKTSVGLWEITFNSEKPGFDGENKGEVDIEVIHPSDFYIGVNFDDIKSAPIVIKTIRKDISYIRNSKLYSDKKEGKEGWGQYLKPDNQVTDDAYRQTTLSNTYGTPGQADDNERGTCLLAECWMRYYPEGETEPKYRIVTFSVKQGLLLRNEKTDYDRPPFFSFHTDHESGEFYGEGWMKHLIPLNKAVDMVENRGIEYHHTQVGGRWIVDRGADLRTIMGSQGQVMLANPGRRVEQQRLDPLPASFRDLSNALHVYAQDEGSVHEASLGRAAQGVDSARGIEAMVQGDVQGKNDLKDNLVDFMEESGEWILMLMDKYYTTRRRMLVYNENGDMEQFYAVGNQGKINDQVNTLPNTAVIKGNRDVRVKMGSDLANTPEAVKEVLVNLYEMQLIPPEEVLKAFGYGNVADIVNKARANAEANFKMRQQQPPPPPTTLKDILQFNADTFFTFSEKVQMKKKLFGIQPDMDPKNDPTSIEHKTEELHSQLAVKQDIQHHAAVTDIAKTRIMSNDQLIQATQGANNGEAQQGAQAPSTGAQGATDAGSTGAGDLSALLGGSGVPGAQASGGDTGGGAPGGVLGQTAGF